MRLGTQSALTSFDDGSVEASVCHAFYDDVLHALLAHPASMGGPVHTWQWARCVGDGTTAISDTPRWRYEVALPPDAVHIVQVSNALHNTPYNPHRRLFERYDAAEKGMGKAGGTVLIPVLFTNHQQVSVTYITNAVEIDFWPPAFRRAFWLSLAASIATTLGIDGSTGAAVAQEAEREVARACLADQRVEVVSTETPPDWLGVRFDGTHSERHSLSHISESIASGYSAGGSQPPSPTAPPYAPPVEPNGVIPTGLTKRDIANGSDTYIPATTPDGRAGILTIGMSPIGWRRPYHTDTINPNASDGTGEYDV